MGDYCESKLCEIKRSLVEEIDCHRQCEFSDITIESLGAMIDMIKDIGEYEKDCEKAKYYKAITYAMHDDDYRMGYIPMEPESRERYERYADERMRKYDMDFGDKHGRDFREYRDARRHYTETHSDHDKTEMEQKAHDHIDGMIETVNEIWKDADSGLKQQIKSQLMNFVNNMN